MFYNITYLHCHFKKYPGLNFIKKPCITGIELEFYFECRNVGYTLLGTSIPKIEDVCKFTDKSKIFN